MSIAKVSYRSNFILRIAHSSLDGYDLPTELQEWLFPADGTTRDFATLQVVFGRGDEFFASDRDGKLEFKEPEKKPPPPEEVEEKPAPLKRSRTISFLRPLSDVSTKQASSAVETPSPSRRSSNASQSASRPPSMSFSTRSMSDASLNSQSISRPPSMSFSRPTSDSSLSQPDSRPPSDPDVKPIDTSVQPSYQETQSASPKIANTRLARRARPLSMSFSNGPFARIPEGKLVPPEPTPPIPPVPTLPNQNSSPCTCGCHDKPKSNYADAAVQTDPLPSPPRTALRIDTSSATSFPTYSSTNSSAQDVQTPSDQYYEGAIGGNPVYMGRMFDYFSKPGYQLGDSLMSSYYAYEEPIYQEPVYEYRDEFGELAAWEAADGKG